MIALLLAAIGDASSAVVDESASVSLLQLRAGCVSTSLEELTKKHHENKAAACATCSDACEQCEISSATCYAGSCKDGSESWCWWISTADSDVTPDGYSQCSDASMLLERENRTKKKRERSDTHMLRTEEQGKTKTKKHEDTHMKDLSSSDKNVEGNRLAQCSTSGMAATGFSRTGKCTDAGSTDAGSHHICIDLKGATVGGQNFCQVTGQSNWCDEQGECQDDESQMCDRSGWCVCQWAFAGFLQNGGSCDQLAVNCDATHMAALEAYRSDPSEFSAALECLEQKCSI
jgi:uncharacterized protein (DUF2237 family)